MDLKLRTHKIGGATVVEVAGEVELHSAGELRDELQQAGEGERPCVVVDLSRVSFIDSTGLGVLVGAFKRVRERGSLSIVCPQRSIRRVFEITGLMQVFPFHQNLDEAVRSCTSFVAGALPASAQSSNAAPSNSEGVASTTTQKVASSTGLHSALSATQGSVRGMEPSTQTGPSVQAAQAAQSEEER
jgi:anti-sigma B factor antagonist